MKDNYLLIHGSFGSPFSNWLPWLRKQIEDKGLTVYTPDFPTGGVIRHTITGQNF